MGIYSKLKIVSYTVSVILLILILIYLLIFGRALKQEENHLLIALNLPTVIFTSDAIKIDEQTYLSNNTSSFIEALQDQGFTHIEQLGAAHVFEKDGKRYISISRMYSSYFIIFTIPETIENK